MISTKVERPTRDIIWTVCFVWLRYNHCLKTGDFINSRLYSQQLNGMSEMLTVISHPLAPWAKRLYSLSV